MVYQSFNNLHLELSEHLGWNEMPATVALPALKEIISNHLNMVAEVSMEQFTEESAVNDLLQIEPDYVFGLLGSDFFGWIGSAEEHVFVSLRGEIEDCMRAGMSHTEAIAEWFK